MKWLIKSGLAYLMYPCKAIHESDPKFHGPVTLGLLVKYFHVHPEWHMSEMIETEYHCNCGSIL